MLIKKSACLKLCALALNVLVRYTPTITQISLGGKYPTAPITVIIFAKSYASFKGSPEDMFKDKNICVKGKITLYKGKPQIIVEEPGDIIVL